MKNQLKAEISLLVYKDSDDHWIAYAPALDLTDYGDSEKDVLRAFETTLEIFLEDTVRRGTLEKELIRLGWVLSKERFEAPGIPTALLNKYITKQLKIIDAPLKFTIDAAQAHTV